MKKLLSLVCVAVMMVFTACEDVPAPYTINSEGNSDTKTLLNETFTSSLGKFTNFTTDGGVAWKNSYSCATATGYDNSTKTTTDGTAYLIGPAVDLTSVDSAYVTYEYILRFNRSQDYQQLLIAEDFVPNANTVTSQAWESLISNHTEGSDYTTFYTATAQIPQKYMGKKVRLALYFKCETNSSTWEVKNLKVMKGEAGTNPEPTPGPTEENTLPYTSSSLKDGFTVVTEKGTAWSLGNSYAKATGYANNTTTPTVSWLISPAINTTKAEGNDEAVVVDFDYVLRYVGAGTDVTAFHKLYASTDFNGDVTTATWTDLGFEAVESATKDWTFYAAPTLTLPATLVGQEKVYFAFRFECNDQNSTTWELKNFKVHQTGNSTPDPDVPEPSGDNLIANGTFETWSGDAPVYWQSTTTASSATLKQSNESHSGSYSVTLCGDAKANKRLAYKEITLKAGTYNFKFYAKAATTSAASVRPGYASMADGKFNYTYGNYVNDITNGEWVEVNHSFTLSSETTINLVVMNPKSPGTDVLIDDAELTTSNGGLATGGDDNGGDDNGGDTGNTSIPYSINFTSSTEGWTIQDVDLGGMNYVWKQDKTYGMKGSAFFNKTNYAAESDFVSSEFTIPASGATLNINHALNFLNNNKRADFVSVQAILASGTKEEIELTAWPAGTDYTYIDATASLDKYAGQTIKIAFHYKSTSTCAPTWEIKTLSIQ